MAISFSKKGLYAYIFGLMKEKELGNILFYKQLNNFIQSLIKEISCHADIREDYKYIHLSGFDGSVGDIYFYNNIKMFCDSYDKIVCLEQESLDCLPTDYEDKYVKAYGGDDTVRVALRKSFEVLFE